MNIKKVRDVLKRDHEVSLQQLAAETGETETELEYVLAEWESKNRIKLLETALPVCGGCSGCTFSDSCAGSTGKRYRWQGKP